MNVSRLITLRLLTLFLTIFLYGTIYGNQPPRSDSLYQEINKLPDDTNKVDSLISLSISVLRSSVDDAIKYGYDAKELAAKLDFPRGEGYALKYIGIGKYFQGKYLEAIQIWIEAKETFETYYDTAGIANMLNNIGAVYFNHGEDTKAIEYYLESLRFAEAVGDTVRIATALQNIGGVYNQKPESENYVKAVEFYHRALMLSKLIKDDEILGTAAVNLGTIFLEDEKIDKSLFHDLDSALYYFEMSLEAFERSGKGNVPFTLIQMGDTYLKKKEYQTGMRYMRDAYKLAEKNDAKFEMAQALIGLGEAYSEEGSHQLAISSFKQAESMAIDLDADYELRNAYEGMAKSYVSLNNYHKAYEYEKLYASIKDTLNADKRRKDIETLQFSFDIDKKQKEVDLLTLDKELQALEVNRQKIIRNAFFAGFVLILIIAFILFRSIRAKIRTNRILDRQKAEIESLILNILPAKVAEELQASGSATPRNYESVSALFTDFKGFTKIAEGLTPNELVDELNNFFMAFDDIVEKFDLEKIKTIGDAYMCAGGIPTESDTHPIQVVQAGLAMQEYMHKTNETRKAKGHVPWELRIGIHTGPVVAGVVGKKKYAYDIWGSSVNISSRMESNGEPGKVNISATTYELIKDQYTCHHRGKISAKNIGEIDMYFVEDKIKQ